MSRTVRAIGLERIEVERLLERLARLQMTLQEAAETIAPPPGVWTLPVDLCESNEAVTICVELPGVEVECIEVALTSEALRISGEKRHPVPRPQVVSHLCSERSYGRFSRVVPLRWPVSVRDATAKFKHGLLTVELPKLSNRRGTEFMVPIKATD